MKNYKIIPKPSITEKINIFDSTKILDNITTFLNSESCVGWDLVQVITQLYVDENGIAQDLFIFENSIPDSKWR